MPEIQHVSSTTTKKGTGTIGVFPRLSLSKVMELPKVIYEQGQGEPVRRLTAFDKLGKAPESGPSRALVTNSSTYGLTKGGYSAEYLEVTERGKHIVAPSNEIQAHEAIMDALFSNPIFTAFVLRF